MKRFFLLLLLTQTIICAAQTFDLGNGRKATITPNSYKLTVNRKSPNGGTLIGTWGGPLKNGKRDGVWKLSIQCNNYIEGEDSKSVTGVVTKTRTYARGFTQGTYVYNSKCTYRPWRWNPYKDRWEYGQPKTEEESVSGSFKNGKAHGKWVIKSTRNNSGGIFYFDEGWAANQWTIEHEDKHFEMEFRNHYLTRTKEIEASHPTWGYGYKWEEADLTALPKQEKIKALSDFNLYPYIPFYLYHYISGSYTISDMEHNLLAWDSLKDASEEDNQVYYMQAGLDDYNSDIYYHRYIWGNAPEEIKAGCAKREAKFEADQAKKKADSVAKAYYERTQKCRECIADTLDAIVKEKYLDKDSIDYWKINEVENVIKKIKTVEAINFLHRHPDVKQVVCDIDNYSEYRFKYDDKLYMDFVKMKSILNDEEHFRAELEDLKERICAQTKEKAIKDGFDMNVSNDSIFKYFSNDRKLNDYLAREYEKKIRTSPIPYKLYKCYLVLEYVSYTGSKFIVGKINDVNSITPNNVINRFKEFHPSYFLRFPEKLKISYKREYGSPAEYKIEQILREVESEKKFQKLLKVVPTFVNTKL